MKFERGYYIDSDTSNYQDYRTKKFESLAEDLITVGNLQLTHKILDFGCACGSLIAILKSKGFLLVTGTDISYWAIKYGRETYNLSSTELQHYNRHLLEGDYDYIFFLDVLEHIPEVELEEMFSIITSNHLMVRIPVSKHEGEDFVLDVSKNDKTHIQIHCKEWWENFFTKNSFVCEKIFTSTESIYESEGVLSRIYVRNT